MFPTIPIDQYTIDCSHGIVNVLFTVDIPLVAKILEDAGLSKAAVERFIAGIDVDIVALTIVMMMMMVLLYLGLSAML